MEARGTAIKLVEVAITSLIFVFHGGLSRDEKNQLVPDLFHQQFHPKKCEWNLNIENVTPKTTYFQAGIIVGGFNPSEKY